MPTDLLYAGTNLAAIGSCSKSLPTVHLATHWLADCLGCLRSLHAGSHAVPASLLGIATITGIVDARKPFRAKSAANAAARCRALLLFAGAWQLYIHSKGGGGAGIAVGLAITAADRHVLVSADRRFFSTVADSRIDVAGTGLAEVTIG